MRISIIVLLIAVVLMTLTFVFCYLIANDQEPISIILRLEVKEKDKLAIDNASLEELENLISRNMVVNSQEKLLEIFANEKANYMNLITIISIVLTVFALFTALNSFIEKSEINRISKDMEKKLADYNEELKKIHFNTFIAYIQRVKSMYNGDMLLHLDTGEVINSYSLYQKGINKDINNVFEYAMRKGISDQICGNSFYIEYFNMLQAMIKYAKNKNFTNTTVLDIDSNEIFRIGINYLHNNIKPADFNDFKAFIDTMLVINWRCY